MDKVVKVLCLVMMALLNGSVCKAQTMGQPFEVSMILKDWNNVLFPPSAVLPDAKSVKIKFVDCNYIKLNNNWTEMVAREWDNSKADAVFNLSGADLDVAKNGNLYVYAGGSTSDSKVFITNYDTVDGASNDNGSLPDGEPGNTGTPGNTGNPGDSGNTTFKQLTDLPTVYLQIYKLNADGTSDKSVTETITKSGGDYHTARIVIVDKNKTIMERDEETEIRGRGNSTWSGDNLKNPYRLKFPRKTQLLSYEAEDGTIVNNYANAKSWTLMSNKGDYSLIRNALSAELGKWMGMPFVPAYKFVDLVINGSYAGTYQISDHVQVSKDRVNVNSDTGWLLSANRGGGYEEDPYFTASGGSFNIKNPDAGTPTANGETTDPKFAAMKTWMANVFKTEWVNGKETLKEDGLAEYFDMESLANYIIGIDITGDPDGAIDNFYMYREDDPSSKMKFGPMWDYDLAYGNVSHRNCAESHFFDDCTYGWGYKVKQIYNTPVLMKALWKRWQEVYPGLADYLEGKVDELDAIIAESQVKNFAANKAGSVAGSNTYSSHEAAVDALRAWIRPHIEWLNRAYKADYKSITGIDPDDCKHTYTQNKYTANTDGTYSQACDKCGATKADSEKFYKFEVYPESAAVETVFAKSWTPAEDKPNSIALVTLPSGMEASIEGYNIVNSTKNADGNQTCADFRLTDGHPYYSDKKFVAANATYTRTLGTDEEYGMMTLPFKHQNAENEDAEFYHIDKVEGDKIYLTAIDPSVEGNASAYLPVIFKRKAGKSSITVTGTDITVKKTTTTDKFNSTCEGWTITGAVENTTATANGLYQMSDAKIGTVANASSVSIAPYRAYLSTTATAPQTLTLVLPTGEEKEVTLIDLVNMIEQLKDGKATKEAIEKIANKLIGKEQ